MSMVSKNKGEYLFKNSPEVRELEEDNEYFLAANWIINNKNKTVEEYKREVWRGGYREEEVLIHREVDFKSQEDFNTFSENLLTDFSFLEGSGGIETDSELVEDVEDLLELTAEQRAGVKFHRIGIVIQLNGVRKLVVDTQGYGYARYVGLLK